MSTTAHIQLPAPGAGSVRISQNLLLPSTHPSALLGWRQRCQDQPCKPGQHQLGRGDAHTPAAHFCYRASREAWPPRVKLSGWPSQGPRQGCQAAHPAPHRTALVLALLLALVQSWCFQLPALQTPGHVSWDLINKVCHSYWRFSLLKWRLGEGSLLPLSEAKLIFPQWYFINNRKWICVWECMDIFSKQQKGLTRQTLSLKHQVIAKVNLLNICSKLLANCEIFVFSVKTPMSHKAKRLTGEGPGFMLPWVYLSWR